MLETTFARSAAQRLSIVPAAWRGVVALLLFLALLPGSVFSAEAAELRVSVSRTPLSLPFYVAESEKYFAAEGVQLKLNEVIGGHRTMEQLLNGEADLATSSEAVVMFNSFKSKDFAVIGTFVTSSDDVKLITRKDAGIARPESLTGKRIGTVVGAASHYYLDAWLLLNGEEPKSVRIINLQPEAMEAAISKGEVDAVAIWEPFPFRILKAVPGTKVMPGAGAYVLSFNLIAHRKLVGERDDDLVRLLRALDRAQRFIKAEPLKAQTILRERLQLDQAFIDWIWPRYNYNLALDQSLIKTLEAEARWARRESMVKAERSPNYLDFIHSGPLTRVRAGAVSIVK